MKIKLKIYQWIEVKLSTESYDYFLFQAKGFQAPLTFYFKTLTFDYKQIYSK